MYRNTKDSKNFAHEQLVLPCNAAQQQPAFFFVAAQGREGRAPQLWGEEGGGSRGNIRALATYTLGGGLCDLVVFGFCDLIAGGSYHRAPPDENAFTRATHA